MRDPQQEIVFALALGFMAFIITLLIYVGNVKADELSPEDEAKVQLSEQMDDLRQRIDTYEVNEEETQAILEKVRTDIATLSAQGEMVIVRQDRLNLLMLIAIIVTTAVGIFALLYYVITIFII